MCGIAGIVLAKQFGGVDNTAPYLRHLKKMTDALAHRGPDGQGVWTNENNILLGHRRLAIIDTSDKAAQPMHYAGRYTIVHNG